MPDSAEVGGGTLRAMEATDAVFRAGSRTAAAAKGWEGLVLLHIIYNVGHLLASLGRRDIVLHSETAQHMFHGCIRDHTPIMRTLQKSASAKQSVQHVQLLEQQSEDQGKAVHVAQ